MKDIKKLSVALALVLSQPLYAVENSTQLSQELHQLKSQTSELIKLLIQEGVLSSDKATALMAKAEENARNSYQTSTDVVAGNSKDMPPQVEPGVVRVPYIPQYIRDQIRDEVRMGLKEDVTRDVLSEAKTKQWGVPGAWPDWIKTIKPYGDIRFRMQSDAFEDDNASDILNISAINDAGGQVQAGDDVFLNTTEDRERTRLRFRFGLKAKITESILVDARFTTGKEGDPVSRNQTLEQYKSSSSFNLDRAYVKYTSQIKDVELTAGRMPNPWFSTDLIWDSDVNFDGLAGTYRWLRTDNIYDEEERAFDPFITLGAFSLQESEFSTDDKWLLAGQVGFDYLFDNQDKLKVGLAYYDYQNIEGKINDPFSTEFDFTAPEFLQFGNTLIDIDSEDGEELYALASDFDQLALTASYDITRFVPTHIIVDAEYVKNVGFDKDLRDSNGNKVSDKSDGYKLKVTVGWPKVRKRHDWQASLAYKYLERDAVLDAFTDSDFRLGGTDAKGYILTGKYGLARNTWLQLRMLVADEIDGKPYGARTLQVDLNTKF